MRPSALHAFTMSDPVVPITAILLVELGNARALSFDGQDDAVVTRMSAALARIPESASGNEALLQARMLRLRSMSLTRLGRLAEALDAYREPPCGDAGQADAEARAMILADMGYRCIAMDSPLAGMRLADAAFRLALANGLPLIASDALAWVSFCHGQQGQLEPSERFALEALGIALQSGDDATIHARLSNLLQLSHLLHDACLNRGDLEGAAQLMRRGARLVSQGERLTPRVGVHERGVWRVHRAGWLRRRGELDLASAECVSVLQEAADHGWAPLERSARFEAARVWQEEGRVDAAIDALLRLIETPVAHDSYHLGLRAHHRLERLLTGQGRLDEARRHDAAYRQLLDQRGAHRADAAPVLPTWSARVLDALAEADRLRIDDEAERLRLEQTDERQRRFLATS